jgi:exonuclease III
MNVTGLFSNTKKRSDVFNWVKAKRISIVCFQETHSTTDVAVKWEDEWGSKCFFSHGDSKSAGVSVMFRNGFDFKVNDSILDQNGRYIDNGEGYSNNGCPSVRHTFLFTR